VGEIVGEEKGSDNGDPIHGIVYCLSCWSRSSHSLKNVLRTIKYITRGCHFNSIE
jgi:hypothetical protein